MTVAELIKILQSGDSKQDIKIIDTAGNYEGDIFTLDSDGKTTYIVME